MLSRPYCSQSRHFLKLCDLPVLSTHVIFNDSKCAESKYIRTLIPVCRVSDPVPQSPAVTKELVILFWLLIITSAAILWEQWYLLLDQFLRVTINLTYNLTEERTAITTQIVCFRFWVANRTNWTTYLLAWWTIWRCACRKKQHCIIRDQPPLTTKTPCGCMCVFTFLFCNFRWKNHSGKK